MATWWTTAHLVSPVAGSTGSFVIVTLQMSGMSRASYVVCRCPSAQAASTATMSFAAFVWVKSVTGWDVMQLQRFALRSQVFCLLEKGTDVRQSAPAGSLPGGAF